MIRIIYLFVGVVILACQSPKHESTVNPNFIIIMADDLGYGDLSIYGNDFINTPNIDYLASEGVRFTDFHSNGSVCSPTRASLLTGRYQQRTGVEGVVTAKSHRDVGLSLDEVTIAEELKKYDYDCAMYGKWHLGYAKEFNPFLQGFDDFVGFVSGNIDYHGHLDQEGYHDWWRNDTIYKEEGYSTDLITKYGVDFIKAQHLKKRNNPFFLYLAHEAPHYPYQRRRDGVLRKLGIPSANNTVEDSLAFIYKEMVETMDEGVGQIITALKESGAYENTMIIFLSDNGANASGSNGVLRGQKGGVYEGGSRVPAIISYSRNIEKGGINNETVMTMDLFPTVLDFINKKPSVKLVGGISIRESLTKGKVLPKRDLFYTFKKQRFVRSGDWKMISRVVNGNQVLELYNLESDILESYDLSLEYPDLLDSLNTKLLEWQKDVRSGVQMVSN